MNIIEENEYCRILEGRGYWILEDKTLLDKPVVHVGETKTIINIRMESAEIDGELKPVRVFFPKEIPYRIVKSNYDRISRERAKLKKEYERLFKGKEE